MKLEVRCCCRPKKLRGWIEVDSFLTKGTHVVFALFFDTSKHVSLKLDWYRPPGKVSLPYLALKSEGVKLSDLRKIYGFEENLAR